MHRLAGRSAFLVAFVSACTATDSISPAPDFAKGDNGNTAWVTTNADAGEGSFRAAVLGANADGKISRIAFEAGLGVIALATPVAYTGSQGLTIDGNNAVIDGGALAGTASAILVTSAADLDLRSFTVREAPGSGIDVQIPAGSSGLLNYSLTGVIARDNGEFGVVINDQVDPSSVEPPARPNSAGSDAGLRVRVTRSQFLANGFSGGDKDGLRVNDGGPGDLDFHMAHSTVAGNGGDGIELDERGPGSARLQVIHSTLTENGEQDPADLDDGIDVDEIDAGDIVAQLVHVKASDNFEEGIDFNENDAGNMQVYMDQVEASRNREEGIDLEEDDDYQGGGNLIAELHNITASNNEPAAGYDPDEDAGDAGIKIRERGAGDLVTTIDGAIANANALSGISNREAGEGKLEVTLTNVVTNGNVHSHGIVYREEDAGDLVGFLLGATSSNNGGAGVRGQEGGAGSGSLTIQGLIANGNGGGVTSLSNVVVLP